jgi:hypothetical protein
VLEALSPDGVVVVSLVVAVIHVGLLAALGVLLRRAPRAST